MIRRPAGCCRIDPVEPEAAQLQRIDEHIARPNGIAPVYPIIEIFRQQRRLLAIHPLNETLHHSLAIQQGNHTISRVFTQAGSEAEILGASRCFPLWPQQRTSLDRVSMSVRCQERPSTELLNDLVCSSEQRRRNGKPKCLRG